MARPAGALAEAINKWQGGVVVISHHQEFLGAVCHEVGCAVLGHARVQLAQCGAGGSCKGAADACDGPMPMACQASAPSSRRRPLLYPSPLPQVWHVADGKLDHSTMGEYAKAHSAELAEMQAEDEAAAKAKAAAAAGKA